MSSPLGHGLLKLIKVFSGIFLVLSVIVLVLDLPDVIFNHGKNLNPFPSTLSESVAEAQTPSGQGIFLVNNCNTISNPVPNLTWCFVPGPPVSISVYNGSTYAPFQGITNLTPTPPISIVGNTISLSGVTSEQGNGSKVQLSTGTTTTNDCVKYDANGNAVDSGGACGAGSGTGLYNKVINPTDPAYGALGNNTGNDQPAIQAAIEAARSGTISNTASAPVFLPSGVYRTLAPIVLRSNLVAGSKNPPLIGAGGYSQSWINAQFVGPAIIAAASVTYPGDRNLTVTANIIPGGSGTSLTSTANMFSPFNLAEVVGLNTSAFPATGAFNGLGQWDMRLFMRDDDTTAAHCMWASDGGLNLILAPGLPASGFTQNTGAMGYLCVGSDAKLYGSLNVNGTEIRVNSGATTVTQGTVYEVELNLDSAHNVNLFMGTGGTITRVAQSASGGTTIKQRADENDYFMADAPVWPTPSGALPWRGAIQSPQISNIARHTAATYTEDTAQFASDANTLFLMNLGLSNFPNGAPYVQVDKGTGSGPWFMAQSDFNSGCCGGQQIIEDIAIEGTATIGIFGDSSVIDVERPVVALGDPSIAGIMTTTNATNGSLVRGAPVYGAVSATFVPVWMTGGITSVENMSLNASSYPLIIQQGGVVSNLFYQTNTRTVCALVDVGGGLKIYGVVADSENGGDFSWFCGQNMTQPVTIDSGDVSNGSIAALASPFTFYGPMGKFTLKDSEIFFNTGQVPSSGSVIDATYAHGGGGHPQVANCSNGTNSCPHVTFDHTLFFNNGNQPSDLPPAGVALTNNGVPYDLHSARVEHADLEAPALPQFTLPQGTSGGGASPLTVNLPVVAPGRIMIANFAMGGFAALPVISSPGWALGCGADDHVNNTLAFGTLWKAASSSDSGGTAVFSWSGGANVNSVTISTFSGLNQSNPIGTCRSTSTGASTTTSFSLAGGANTDQNSLVMNLVQPQPSQGFTAPTLVPPALNLMRLGQYASGMSEFVYMPRSATEPTMIYTTSPAAKVLGLQMELLPDLSQTSLMPMNAGSPLLWWGESLAQIGKLLATKTAIGTLGVGDVPAPLATFGTCDAAHEGLYATETNSTAACSSGATATSAGTTHCAMRCNGTNWIQTGL